jgi:hypothetical protein
MFLPFLVCVHTLKLLKKLSRFYCKKILFLTQVLKIKRILGLYEEKKQFFGPFVKNTNIRAFQVAFLKVLFIS